MWDIEQQIQMSPEERLRAVDELKRRVYADTQVLDIRESKRCLKIR